MTEIRSYRDLMARNDEAAERFYSQFSDEHVTELTADIDQHA